MLYSRIKEIPLFNSFIFYIGSRSGDCKTLHWKPENRRVRIARHFALLGFDRFLTARGNTGWGKIVKVEKYGRTKQRRGEVFCEKSLTKSGCGSGCTKGKRLDATYNYRNRKVGIHSDGGQVLGIIQIPRKLSGYSQSGYLAGWSGRKFLHCWNCCNYSALKAWQLTRGGVSLGCAISNYNGRLGTVVEHLPTSLWSKY